MTIPSEGGGRRSDTVALIVADEQDRLLVMWHEKHAFWTVPLGKVEEGEVDVGAARREAFEELGIVSDHVELLDTIHKPADLDEYSDILIALCLIANYTGEVANREPDKHRGLHFAHLAEIADMQPLSYPTKFIVGRDGVGQSQQMRSDHRPVLADIV
ncbi:NUDIX hydrolase [Sphingomonas sp. 22L2VL55-3]